LTAKGKVARKRGYFEQSFDDCAAQWMFRRGPDKVLQLVGKDRALCFQPARIQAAAIVSAMLSED